MYAIGGGIVGTGITTIFTDRIADQIEANRIVLYQLKMKLHIMERSKLGKLTQP